MEYPEEIYRTLDGGLLTESQRSRAVAMWPRRHAYEVGYDVGYVAGKTEQSDYIESMSSLESVLTDVEQLEGEDLPFVKRLIERTVRAVRAEQADHLTGFSNLTEAISAGEPIDWVRLDGLKVQCVNLEVRGEIHGTLKQNGSLEPYLPGAWWDEFSNAAYINALYDGWYGNDGWTVWVEGEIPLRRKTADQLEVGNYFLGEIREKRIAKVYVGETLGSKVVLYIPRMGKSEFPASKWEVIEEYGPFQKPEGK